ncbi:hypothetical protein K8R30_03400 [archaeon]|nr:hypothetical protein [archaeon]
MVSVKVDLKKGDFIWVGLFVILFGVSVAIAYGGDTPPVMGHNLGELDLPACANGQIMVKNDSGWDCENASVGASDICVWRNSPTACVSGATREETQCLPDEYVRSVRTHQQCHISDSTYKTKTDLYCCKFD